MTELERRWEEVRCNNHLEYIKEEMGKLILQKLYWEERQRLNERETRVETNRQGH